MPRVVHRSTWVATGAYTGEQNRSLPITASWKGHAVRVDQSLREMVPRGPAVALAVGGLATTMATHAAVLTGRLPHTVVSGGRVKNPGDGRRVAALSLCSHLPVVALVARGAGIAGKASRAERRLLGLLSVAALGSVPLQALGTPFERRYMAPAAAGLSAGLGRLAMER